MFRQAHIILARYLAHEMQAEVLQKHDISLSIGSIMPDSTIRMRMKHHEFDETWEDTKERIYQMEAMPVADRRGERAFCREMGIILHYLADYFTCPHNPSYGLNLMQHGIYEGWEALELRKFLYTPEADAQFQSRQKSAARIHGIEELFAYIEWMHDRYLERSGHTPYSDCRWILNVCAVAAIVLMKNSNAEP